MGAGSLREGICGSELVQGKTSEACKGYGRCSKEIKIRYFHHTPLYASRFNPFSVLTAPQRQIFDEVKAFVMENRAAMSTSHTRSARLTMPNTFPARERAFISTLAQELHLCLTWDEYDEDDQNLVTWRFPGASLEEPIPASRTGSDGGGDEAEEGDGEWEDVDEEEDEEANSAVDRVLQKYEKAQVMDDDADGGFDARYERSVREKMDEWKRGYYMVGCRSIAPSVVPF